MKKSDKINRKKIIAGKCLMTLLAFALMLSSVTLLGGCRGEQAETEGPGEIPVFGERITGDEFQVVKENSVFELQVIPDTGEFRVISKETGKEYRSNPLNREDDTIARDAWRTNMQSQLIVNFSNNAGNIYSQTNSEVGSFRKGGLNTYLTEEGIIISYTFVDERITIPLEIKLNDYGFSANVLMDKVHGDGHPNFITGMSVLPFLGAATMEDEGYMLVPDGSGALINLNNEKFSSGTYTGNIYGQDSSFVPLQSFSNRKNSFLPVYGIKAGDSALFGIITDGESLGTINANVSGLRTTYNFIYPSFQIRARDSFFIEDRSGSDRENFVLDRTPLKTDAISIDFYILEGEQADYMGMAYIYRNYLYDDLEVREDGNMTGALYLDLFAGVRKTESRFGIPITGTSVLTSFSDALGIVDHFRDHGVDEFVVRMRNAQAQDINKKPARRFSLNRRIGSRSDFEALVDSVGEGRVYLSMDPINIRSDRWIVRTIRNSAQTVMGLPAFQMNHDMASGFRDNSNRWYLLSPHVGVEYFASYIQGAVRSEYTRYVAIEEIGHKLYSNYGSEWFNTEKTKDYWTAALSEAEEMGARMMVEGANAYAIPYAERLAGIPTSSSNFGLIDTEIPFTQLAINGIIEYASEPINLSSNPRRAFLKAIESDSCLSYAFIEEDPVVLRDTELSWLYGSYYKGWTNEVSQNYAEYRNMKAITEFTPIADHEILETGVVRVTYENGAYVIINYNTRPVTIDNKVVDALSFEVYERME